MLALAVVAARLAQFSGAMVLLGAPLFFIYALPAEGPGAAKDLRWPRPFLLGAAAVLAIGAIVSLSAQTAVMSGSTGDAFKADALISVASDSAFGRGTAGRILLAVVAGLALTVVRPSRGLWLGLCGLAAIVAASFAWTGHGAADDGAAGWVHLIGDVFHLLAAAVWLGALASLSVLLLRSGAGAARAERAALHGALAGFSGVGSAVVAVLLATGLINSWFLVGPSRLTDLFRTAYGLVLMAKIALFGAMLALAAANRFRLTPRLGQALGAEGPAEGPVAALWRSVLLESTLALLVLALVSVLGTLAPPSSQ